MNLNQNFAISFQLKKSKVNAQGLSPIRLRITIDGKENRMLHQEASNGRAYPGKKKDAPVCLLTFVT